MTSEKMSDTENNSLDAMAERLSEYGKKKAFKNTLTQVAQEYHNQPAKRKPAAYGMVISLWRQVRVNGVAAACIAILTAFSTLWLSGYYKTMEKNSSNYRELRRDMNTVKRNVNAQQMAIKGMNNDLSGKTKGQNNFGATGFMLSPDGYVVTNHHVIADADSVHLQNSKGESYTVKVIYTDPEADLAILQITDSKFRKMKPTPYAFKKSISELGEDVYTLGFPRDEAVYGQGYLSSMSGYSGDTSAYQISIPLNPGNSGGPLLDSKGNIIGIISGKHSGLDGTSFAIKTNTIIASINEIPEHVLDSRLNLNTRNNLTGLPRTEQVKRIQDYVFIVKVF